MAIQRGDVGALVRSWQEFLVAQKLLQVRSVTGGFDAVTQAATIKYQQRKGLTRDGVVGSGSLRAAKADGWSGVVEQPQYSLLYGLQAAAFDDDIEHPHALVHIPPRFDFDRLNVVIYLHGLGNNVENVARAKPLSSKTPCADLIGHLGRAGKNALLVLPETKYNANSSDPGRLGEPGGLRALLAEVLALLATRLGQSKLTVEQLQQVCLVSHSGGYRAAAAMATEGGVAVQELYLLDSLYGQDELFTRYLESLLSEVQPGAAGQSERLSQRRFVTLYTRDGGTWERSVKMQQAARALIQKFGADESWLRAESKPVPPTAVPWGTPLLLQPVAAAHSDLPIQLCGSLLKNSALPAI